MADAEPPFTDVFASLSPDGKQLIREATYYPTNTGGKREALLANLAFSEEQFNKATKELIERGLLKRGQPEQEQNSREHRLHFVENPDGDNLALPKDVKEAFLTKVLGLKLNGLKLNPAAPDF
jgi:hypothetical protein